MMHFCRVNGSQPHDDDDVSASVSLPSQHDIFMTVELDRYLESSSASGERFSLTKCSFAFDFEKREQHE